MFQFHNGTINTMSEYASDHPPVGGFNSTTVQLIL